MLLSDKELCASDSDKSSADSDYGDDFSIDSVANKENLNDSDNPMDFVTSTPCSTKRMPEIVSMPTTPNTSTTSISNSSGYNSLNSSDIVSMLQTQQQLLEKLVKQQEELKQKQDQFNIKLDATESRLLAIEEKIQDESSSSSSKEQKKHRIPRDLSVSMTH